MAALAEGSRRKSSLLRALGQHLASYRPDKGAGTHLDARPRPLPRHRDWRDRPALRRDLRSAGRDVVHAGGVPDAETALRKLANKGSSVHALAVRPSWSYPAPEWVRWNPEPVESPQPFLRSFLKQRGDAHGHRYRKRRHEHLLQGWGTGQPIVFSHGWPLTADVWDDQMVFLAEQSSSKSSRIED